MHFVCVLCKNLNESKLIYDINNKKICYECSENTFVCGKCNICYHKITCTKINNLFIMNCINCDLLSKIVQLNIEDNLILYLNEFKTQYPMFERIKIMSETIFNLMYNSLNNHNTINSIINYFYSILTINNYFLLNTEQAIKIFNFIHNFKTHDGYNFKSAIYHAIIPSIFNLKEIKKIFNDNEELKQYYFENKKELWFIWSYCKLSRFGKINQDKLCYLCLNNLNFERYELGDHFMIGFDAPLTYCGKCGTSIHTNCMKTKDKYIGLLSCGFCRNKFQDCFDMIHINREWYIKDIYKEFNIQRIMSFTFNINFI